MPIVICNAGPLMALGKLNRLELLTDLYNEIQIPQAVYKEVVTAGLARGAPDAQVVRLFCSQRQLPVVSVSETTMMDYTPQVILDPGETEVLALAQSVMNPFLLMDDEVARAEARRLKIQVRGTLGVLVQAHRSCILTFKQIKLLIEEIATRPDIWIAARLCEQVLVNIQKNDKG
ncbi:MAG: hypothetical protein U9Q82_05015 [Chloroflexota bacterium]|nr:hypothetical protein [Chloroflexota bacterium]